MRKFKRPIDSYEMGRHRCMSMEQDPSGLGKYARFKDHFIYYQNALNYCGGELYRAVLGYENLWDRKAERQLMLCLDFYLQQQVDKRKYYLEETTVKQSLLIHGVKWPRQIPPKTLNFDLQWPFQLQEGEALISRINLLDKPYHVDIERSNGEIFTVPFTRYQNLVDNGMFKRKPRKENYEKRSRSATTRTATPKAKGLSLVGQPSKVHPFKEIPQKLLHLRKRFGNDFPL